VPELPEVETIKRELAGRVVGRRFSAVSLLWPGMVRQPSPQELCQQLPGQVVRELGRRGKYLIFHLRGGQALVLHLRMTGSLLLKETPAETERYTRAIFYLEGGLELHFLDRRKLGTISLLADEAWLTERLGPEPLDPTFTSETLAGCLRGRKAPIKALLCDQSLIAGIGNMYADESLFAARIHPLRGAGGLSGEEVERLHRAIGEVLRLAISNKGASISDYRRPDGEPGIQQYSFKVAHRGGVPCPVCGAEIQRRRLRGRGTYFCPQCQK